MCDEATTLGWAWRYRRIGTESRRTKRMKLVGDAEVRVFSDDPRWCEESLQSDAPFSVEPTGDSARGLQSLAHADAMVASASTYSWWAGFLGGGSSGLSSGSSRDGNAAAVACPPRCWTVLKGFRVVTTGRELRGA